MSKKEKTEVPEEVVSPTPPAAVVPVLSAEAKKLLARKMAAQTNLISKMGVTGCVASALKAPEFYPTGLPVFDREVLGIGGLPKGRIIEVYGPKSSGKSALSYHLSGKVQAQDPCAIVKIYDREHSCTAAWLKSMGLDLDRTIVIGSPDEQLGAETKPLSAEDMSEMIHADLAMGELAPAIIIIDSIAVIQTATVMETAIEDRTMRDNLERSSFLTKFFDGLTDGFYYPAADDKGKLPAGAKSYNIGGTQTCLVCINHAKERQKSIGGGKTITEWYSVGGVSLDFHACLQLMVTRRGFEKGMDGNFSHQKVHVCADKNKVAPPKRECDLLLCFKGGLEQLGTIDWLSIAITKGLARKEGSWIKAGALVPGGKIQGEDAFNKFIEGNEDARKLLVD